MGGGGVGNGKFGGMAVFGLLDVVDSGSGGGGKVDVVDSGSGGGGKVDVVGSGSGAGGGGRICGNARIVSSNLGFSGSAISWATDVGSPSGLNGSVAWERRKSWGTRFGSAKKSLISGSKTLQRNQIKKTTAAVKTAVIREQVSQLCDPDDGRQLTDSACIVSA